MDIKLRNRYLVVISLVLLTFGASGSLSFFTNDAYYYNYNQNYYSRVLFMVYGLSAILSFLISLYLIYNRQILIKIVSPSWQERYNRLPIDIMSICLFITGIYTLTLVINQHPFNLFIFIRDLILNTSFMTLTLIQIVLLRNRISNQENLHKDWEKSVMYRGLRGITDAFHFSSIGMQVFFLLVVLFCSGIGVPIVIQDGHLAIIYFFLFIICTLPNLVVTAKRIGQFNRVTHHVDSLANGQMVPDLPIEGWSALKKLSENINTLKHGVTFAQKEMSKSERLKTELITNVSHDLRTPLTSIMTYSELLQKEGLTDEERASYVEIIDRKSKRLKVLIEDLFEASKMASGNIELEKKKVDLVQLLQQALAENDDLIKTSTLQVRFTKPDHSIYAVVDGQKLWRVFDNLIGNCLKYSLENTRVFIALKEINGHVMITFKNISKYELSEDSDELFERFKRGDESRQTDGSGLGLAIAKSIMDLHEGDLEIQVDGDLFKVTVKLDSV